MKDSPPILNAPSINQQPSTISLLSLAKQWLQPWGRAAWGLFFAPSCRICNVPLHQPDHEGPLCEFLCDDCESEVPLIEPPYCSVCGASYSAALGGREFRCDNCSGRKFAFEFAIAGYHAKGHARLLVHRFKYNRDLSLCDLLAAMLARGLSDPRLRDEDLSTWTLVPVPLHYLRHRRRQFNQAWELCQVLSKTHRIPALDAMLRIHATDQQADLTRAQRLANLRSAMAMRPAFAGKTSALRGKRVLLVDDVFTTGATTDACARVLRREAGVEKVVVITAARG